MRPQFRRRPQRDRTRLNRFIRVPEIRCVDSDGSQIGIIPTREALALAQKKGLDLVEIAPMAKPPVCRIMDYGKFKYDKEKRERQARKHQTSTKLKEVKFHANVGEHDYETKVRHARDFLEQGHRVKFSLYFRGRENAHHELGFDVMNRCAADCGDVGVLEQAPRLMGRSLIMMMNAKPRRSSDKDSDKKEETE